MESYTIYSWDWLDGGYHEHCSFKADNPQEAERKTRMLLEAEGYRADSNRSPNRA